MKYKGLERETSFGGKKKGFSLSEKLKISICARWNIVDLSTVFLFFFCFVMVQWRWTEASNSKSIISMGAQLDKLKTWDLICNVTRTFI